MILEVTDQEIITIVKKLKNRKSPGDDGITNEMIKYGGERLLSEIIKLVKQIFQKTKIPDDWKTSIVIPVFKKGEKTEPGKL